MSINKKLVWYLSFGDGALGHWHTTKQIWILFWGGILRPYQCTRWQHFKNFHHCFWTGFKKHKPQFLDLRVSE